MANERGRQSSFAFAQARRRLPPGKRKRARKRSIRNLRARNILNERPAQANRNGDVDLRRHAAPIHLYAPSPEDDSGRKDRILRLPQPPNARPNIENESGTRSGSCRLSPSNSRIADNLALPFSAMPSRPAAPSWLEPMDIESEFVFRHRARREM